MLFASQHNHVPSLQPDSLYLFGSMALRSSFLTNSWCRIAGTNTVSQQIHERKHFCLRHSPFKRTSMLPCPTSRISLGEPSSVMRGFHRDAGSDVSICRQRKISTSVHFLRSASRWRGLFATFALLVLGPPLALTCKVGLTKACANCG